MATVKTSEEKFIQMTQTPVRSLILKLAIPTIASMLITSFYNMADTFFVGKISTSASGAVGVAFSLMALIQAIGFTVGNGAGNYISRLLGAREDDRAAKVASTGVFLAIGIGLLGSILGNIFIDPLVRLLGATDTIAPLAGEYIRIILIGMPWMAPSFVLNLLLRSQGGAVNSMFGIMAGGVLNVILDPIFIFTFDMGVAGAAIATIIGQLVSFCILLLQCQRGIYIKIRFSQISFDPSIYREIITIGLPTLFRQGLASIAMVLLVSAARPFGDAAIASMTIINRVFQFSMSVMLGFVQGYQPVCGFSYGAALYDRLIEGFWFTLKGALILMIFSGVLFFIASPLLISIFRDDPEVIDIGTRALRLQSLAMPFAGFTVTANMTLQTLGKSGRASILAMGRQGLFFIPLITVLPRYFGLLGVQMSQPIADLFTGLLAIPMLVSIMKEIKELNRIKKATQAEESRLTAEEIEELAKKMEEIELDSE